MMKTLLLKFSISTFVVITLLSSCKRPFNIKESEILSSDTSSTILYKPWMERFSSQFLSFEKTDKALVENFDFIFIGSSVIARWETLRVDMAPLNVLNRGISGATIREIIFYLEKLIGRRKPKAIVVYDGDNDISLKQDSGIDDNLGGIGVFNNFKILHRKIKLLYPKTKLVYISIKPAPARILTNYPDGIIANNLIKEYCSQQQDCTYIDVANKMFDEKGNIITGIWELDGNHLNSEGYKLWTSIIKPIMSKL